jgi:hypothetical protein
MVAFVYQPATAESRSARWCPQPPAGSIAYLDESYEPTGPYILAALVVAGTATAARQQLASLAHPARRRFHFSKETSDDRLRGALTVADLAVPLVVVIRTGEAKPERARGICLAALLWHLHGRVERLVLESRTAGENTRDARTLSSHRPRCCDVMTYDFVPAVADPLLWGADIVASAGFQDRARQRSEYFDVIRTGTVEVYDL